MSVETIVYPAVKLGPKVNVAPPPPLHKKYAWAIAGAVTAIAVTTTVVLYRQRKKI